MAIDDFGTGYSSLARLRELPVEIIKIDQSFMRSLPENRQAAEIVTAIIRLAEALGTTAVAEGVETEAQRRFLRDHQCPLAQGYHLGRPLEVPAVTELLRAGSAA